MKFSFLLSFLTFFILNSSFLIAEGSSWQALMDSSNVYQEKQDFETALDWALKAEVKAKDKFGELDTNYVVSLETIYTCHYYLGNYEKAIEYCEQVIPIIKDIKGVNHPDYATSINNLAAYYRKMGLTSKAELLYIKSIKIWEDQIGENHPNYASSLNNLAYLYYSIRQYSKAEPLYIKAMEIRKEQLGTNHPNFAASLNNLALLYEQMGQYSKAEPLYMKAMKIKKEQFGENHPKYAASLNNLAGLYEQMGQYSKAEPLYIQSLEIKKEQLGENHLDYAISINNLAVLYERMKLYSKAETLHTQSLEIIKEKLSKKHRYYAMSLNNLAMLYNSMKQYSKAEPLYIEAMRIWKELLGAKHPKYALSLNNLGGLYNSMGQYSKAEPLYIKAMKIWKEQLGENHPDYTASLNNLANLYISKGQYSKAEPLYIKALYIKMNNFLNQSVFLSEKEKGKFWNTMKSYFDAFHSFAIKRMYDNPKILSNVFDNRLFTKAILFNSTNNIKNRILKSGDDELIEKYDEFIHLKEQLAKYYYMSFKNIKKRDINFDSIENCTNNLEKEISLKSEDYKLRIERKKITWEHIQFQLLPDEAVIEMVRFRLYDNPRWTDTVYYAALIITEETTEHPDIVILENGNELENDYFVKYRKDIMKKRDNAEAFNQFWQKIYDKTKSYKKIYYTPDGIYNKLNISTFLMPDGEYLIDKQEIHTLNSSKDVLLSVYKKQEGSQVFNSAELFGNPDFNLNAESLQMISKSYSKEDESISLLEETTRGVNLTNLPGTEKEVKNIEEFLKSKKWDVKTHTKQDAIKTAVKAVESPRVLHIATHGMFLEDVKQEEDNFFGIESHKMIQNPLLRSGLFFAGAASMLNKDTAIAGNDNGLLTAYEAMNLNLDKTELVVLSACETGLGEIRNGEGVFGLRRAFQQAGAKSVLMSLWTINDQATQELMTAFYEKWLSGMTKRQAFIEAQQDLKRKYRHPYYWGAFVMVGE